MTKKTENTNETIMENPEIIEQDTPQTEETNNNVDEKSLPRYDVMITAQNAGYRAPRVAIGNMVQMLAFRGIASPVDEAIAENWIEIYFEPGVSSHEIFLPKQYDGPHPVFYEALLRFETDPFHAEYGKTETPLYWCLEFRGCLFKEPLGPFRKLLSDTLNLRPEVHTRPHTKLPPHREVSEDEMPIEKLKTARGPGLAGTDVEEV